MDPPFLLVEEAADFCGTTPATIRRWIGEGKISARRIGRRYLIPRVEFLDTIAEGGQLRLPFPKEESE